MIEDVWIWLAWRLPRVLVKWAAVRLMTWRCDGNPGERRCIDALKGWPR